MDIGKKRLTAGLLHRLAQVSLVLCDRGRGHSRGFRSVPGAYYLLFVADPENTVSEQNEENNIVHSTLTVTSQGGSSTPVSNFSVDNQFIGAGTTVQFTDLSSNNPTSWQWSFPGGTPSYSTAQNPNITYSSNGTYDVSLTTSNSNVFPSERGRADFE